MISLALILLPVMAASVWMFLRWLPAGRVSPAFRTFNRCAWLVAVGAALLAATWTWGDALGSVDYAWWPVFAAFTGVLAFISVLVGAAALRFFVFRARRA